MTTLKQQETRSNLDFVSRSLLAGGELPQTYFYINYKDKSQILPPTKQLSDVVYGFVCVSLLYLFGLAFV